MDVSQMLGDHHSPNERIFIMEKFPSLQHELAQEQHEPQVESQGQTPHVDAASADNQAQGSDFAQDFYTESNVRRVQPARARRTDFGKHTADELIIDAIERAEKEKPVIPPDTVFYCTTDNSMMPNMEAVLASIHPAGTGPADELPMHSYFRDPEVMRKIRSQELIETPSWREATQADWDEALKEIPEAWRTVEPDTSLDYYRRHHIKLERSEATSRNREKARLARDYHHLEPRLVELQHLDTSGFRGETPAEQEQDKILVLAAAKKLLENQRVKGKVEDKELEEGAEDGVAEAGEDHGAVPIKATTTRPPKKKKESKWQYYPADFDPEGELIGDSSKKKKPKKKVPARSDRSGTGGSRKRKRDLEDVELEYVYGDEDIVLEQEAEEDEYMEGAQATAFSKKTKPAPAPKRATIPPKVLGLSTKDKEKDEKASKLLDAAKKYNPRRPPRDIYPFGAPLPELEVVDFDLPTWLGWKFYDPGAEDEVATEMQADEHTRSSVSGADRMELAEEYEVPVAEQQQVLSDEQSIVTTGEDEISDHNDAPLQPFLQELDNVERTYSMMDDAESSILSELTDEGEGEDAEGDVDADGEEVHDEPEEVLEDEVEEEEEEYQEEEYSELKPAKPKRSIGRSHSNKSKKARRR